MTPYEEPPGEPPPKEPYWGQSPDTPEEPVLLHERPVRAYPGLAWAAIIVVTCLVAVLQYLRPEIPAAVNAPAPKGDEMAAIYDLQARYLVGVGDLMPEHREAFAEQIRLLESGDIPQRLGAAVLYGELVGSQEALECLSRIERSPTFRLGATREQRQLVSLLSRLYRDYAKEQFDGPSLDDEQREFLREELNWYGDLALAPRKGPDKSARAAALAPAQRVTTGILAGLAGGCGALVLGLGFLIVLIVMLAGGPLRRGFKPGSDNSGLYAETFAIWMIVFVGLQVLMQLAFRGDVPVPVMAILPLSTLLVLHWPVMRGANWQDVRRDVGLSLNERPLAEVVCGPVTWLAALPLVAVGVVVVVAILIAIYGKVPLPTAMLAQMPIHPIVLKLRDADAGTLFFLFFAACVTAPIVEEVFFRGVFYRHLREGTNRWGFGMSLMASAVVNSFIFAAVHPQGLVGIPLLMPLAFVFSLAREWRGSLVSCIVAHALNNGLVLLLAVNLFKN